MKTLALALSAATLTIAAAPASAATFVVTGNTAATASQFTVPLAAASGGDGTFASGSFDITSSVPRNVTKFFNITYDFIAPATGTGLFTFTTSSTGSAALKILGFSTSSMMNTLISSTTTTLNGVSTTTYTGSTPISLAAGSTQSFSISGSVLRTGSLTTNVSFAAAVPETATWLMMFAGIGMIGGALRVRRRQVRFAAA